ncbi:hypothetical protein BJP34_16780 [Moorena producens PAL-8-15-08-1]|uniref:Peptidase S74 domain-containing protein n=1 Tax=Moorena producens PAL-8-15-08-1 TaxID=1458985 RepID=A0A1D8TTB8_9CYAN|nr:DUF6519 domain-containing protein [Moorena producens]AOX00880.1 hypothetical protein BJP34_16780 [Moorena producens PAL-8-15-08-1]
MKGDFTRWTFDPSNRYSSVRLQQGRVLLDADWNEQLDIIAYREQIANKEIIGLNGVPDRNSFKVEFDNAQQIIKLAEGRCYVEGILCETLQDGYQREITDVPGILAAEGAATANPGDFLVYLEVWQHHITAIEDQDLLEPALGGPDTTTRTETYWQLKAQELTEKEQWRHEWKTLLSENQQKGKLKVKSGTALPNDLYRVEIHQVADNVEDTTFKWARNNASMAAKVTKIETHKVTVLKNNQIQFPEEQGKEWWIEITDEDRVKTGEPGFFLKVDHVGESNDGLILTINQDTWNQEEIDQLNPDEKITTVRIWEANAREIKFLSEEEDSQDFIELEKGLQVKFVHTGNEKYRTGDYWLIPTRSQQEVVWPADDKEPDGIVYHYCPLAIVNYNDNPTPPTLHWTVLQDCREIFPALTEMARETGLYNGVVPKGRKLSIGVHSYNDARRDQETEPFHTDDQLEIQGGKQLTLNVGYWKDELEEKAPDPVDQAISFSICEEEVMRLTKDNLSIIGNKDLIVEGTSWLKGVVAIGTEPPDETIGLLVNPDLTNDDTNNELIGQKLAPKLTAYADNNTLTALDIDPTFNNNGKTNVSHYGLKVQNGEVLIGHEQQDLSNKQDLCTGVYFRPEVTATKHKQKLAALYINPNFNENGQSPVYKFGLMIEKGKVGIGRETRTRDEEDDQHRIGVDLRPEVDARDSNDKLVGLYIKPDFKDTCSCGITEAAQYGLIVEEGRVAFGPKLTVNGNQEYLVDIGKDPEHPDDLTKARLKVAGDLEVYGKVTYHAEKGEPGNVELGQQNQDKLLIHGKLETQHTSGKLKVISPLEVQLEEGDTQDFLSLFAANDSALVNGRIVWKKGIVTQEGIDEEAEDEEDTKYKEEAQEAAAIYSVVEGNGSSTSSGELRFSTGQDGTLADRVVIKPDGNVGIGTDDPETNQLKVTGTTDLHNLVVNHKLQVNEDAETDVYSLNITGDSSRTEPTLLIAKGNVCIGADVIPQSNVVNGKNVKLYVKGEANQLVSFDTNLSVLGSTDLETLTVTPELVATQNNEILTAARIEPSFNNPDSYSNVKNRGLHVTKGDVVLDDGNLEVESGKLVIGTPIASTSDKLRVKGGSTLLEGDLQIRQDASIALKVNQATQEVGIGGDSQTNYKLAVAGATKLTGKLEVAPSLIGTSNATEITPTLTSSANNDVLAALRINPTFTVNGSHTGVNTLGLVVEQGDVVVNSGKVAIGSATVDPDHALSVTGGSTIDILTVTGESTLTSTLSVLEDVEIAGNTNLDGALTVDGSVGIGTTAPQAKLQVSGGAIMPAAGNTQESGILFPKNPGGGGADAAWIRYYAREGEDSAENTTFEIGTSNDSNDHIVLNTSGAVGIGKVPGEGGQSPVTNLKLDVNGQIQAHNLALSSDATLKENVKPLKNGLKKILGLRGVSYQWKDEQKATQETQIGLVAQEVEEVFPELVSTDSQGMKSLSYSKLIAPLIEAIKEQNKKILELAKQVKQQQTKITQLQALNKE